MNNRTVNVIDSRHNNLKSTPNSNEASRKPALDEFEAEEVSPASNKTVRTVQLNKQMTQVNTNDFRSYRNPSIDYKQGAPYKNGLKANSGRLREKSKAADRRKVFYKVTKRFFDFVVSLLVIIILILVWPITLAVFIITASSTKAFPIYTQIRVGKNGQLFTLLKLRSMVGDSDNVEKYLNEQQLSQWHTERKIENDPRITKFGAIMRKTSLDEIPQFINVLFGQMSIIGPRPISEEELEWYSDKHKAYLLSVPQGITGWWQVRARTKATFENHERQDLELYYAGHANWKLDFEVFLKTFGVMFGKNKTGR